MAPDVLKQTLRKPKRTNLFLVFTLCYVLKSFSRAVHLLNKELGTNVVIGGTSILNFDLFNEELKQACTT